MVTLMEVIRTLSTLQRNEFICRIYIVLYGSGIQISQFSCSRIASLSTF